MKKNITMAMLVIFCFLFQNTVFNALSFGDIGPNLLIIVTAVFGFMHGKKSGLLVGFFSGLLMDVFFGNVLGFYALIYMYIGFANGFFRKIFFRDDIKLPLVLILSSDIAYSILVFLLLFVLRSRFHFSFYFLHVIIPEAVYTILVSMALYPFILWLSKKTEDSPNRSVGKFV
mgnify:CR=1 FL=1